MISTQPTALRRATNRALRTLGNLAAVSVTLVAVAFLLPSLFGFERYVITGQSMSGTFERGPVAFEKTVPVDRLAVGDVITYLPPADSGLTSLVTHRIASKHPSHDGGMVLRTRGDANADADPWQFRLSAETQPRVEFTVPTVGHVFIALADRDIRILVIGVPAALLALVSLLELIRALRPRKRPVSAYRIPQQRRPALDQTRPTTRPAGV